MKTKQIAVVAVITILLIAGVAAMVSLTHSDSGSSDTPSYGNSTDVTGRLTIFGNANNDDYLDERDVQYVKDIISGDEEAVYFDCYKVYGGNAVSRTFADANCDGKIDEADVSWIQSMVDRQQNMLIYYYDVDSVIASCTYPIDTMCIGYKSNYEAVLICGAADRCVGACNQVSDNGSYSAWYQAFSGAAAIGSRFAFDYEEIATLNADAIITGTRAWFDENMEETCGPLGIDIVRLPFWEDDVTVSGVITLGYLLNCEETAYDYAETADSVLQTIQDKIASIPETDRKLVFASYNGTKISTLHNGIEEMVNAAGGLNPVDVGYTPGSIDGEGILMMDPDYIVFDVYYGFLESFNTDDPEATLDEVYNMVSDTEGKYLDIIAKTNAYNEGNVCAIGQGIYMGPASYIGVAYLANQLYPELFDFDVDALFEEYVSSYHSDLDVSDFTGVDYFDLNDLDAHYSN